MSDVMLFGVLRMPYEMAMGDDLSRFQFWQRAQEAADRISTDGVEINRLMALLSAALPAPASTGRDMLPVGTLAWALIAPNGNIRTWSYSRTNVDRVHAYAPECTVVPVIGARPVQATSVAARELDVEAERLEFEADEIEHQQARHPQEPLADEEKAYLLRRDPQQRDSYAACGGEWDGWLRRAARSAAQSTAPVPADESLTCDEIEALRSALSWMGESTYETLEECGIYQHRLVRRLIHAVVENRDAAYAVQPPAPVDTVNTSSERVQNAQGNRHVESAPVSTEQAGDAWISVEDRLPEKECLAAYSTPNGKVRLIRAKYARKFQIEAEDDDCETEYNEDDDTFYIKEGWLECIDNWGEYSSCYVVEGIVTHWMPMPAAPSANNSPVGADKEPK